MSASANRVEQTRERNAALAELASSAAVEVFHRMYEMALTSDDPDTVRKIWEGFVRKAETAEPKVPQLAMAPMILNINLGDDAVQEPPPKRNRTLQVDHENVSDAVEILGPPEEAIPENTSVSVPDNLPPIPKFDLTKMDDE